VVRGDILMIVASMTQDPATGKFTIKVVHRYEECGTEVFLTRATHQDPWVSMEEIKARYRFQPEIFDRVDPECWYVLTDDNGYLQPDCLTLLECLDASMIYQDS
jgi:hypothetical protein